MVTGRDLAMRLLGVASLGASWGTCLWLRALMGEAPHEPTLLQAALVLASFVLTSIGLLLLLNGARLLAPPGRIREDGGSGDTSADPDPLAALSLIDERAGRADMLARRAIRSGGAKKKGG